jgi:hypothetical protein
MCAISDFVCVLRICEVKDGGSSGLPAVVGKGSVGCWGISAGTGGVGLGGRRIRRLSGFLCSGSGSGEAEAEGGLGSQGKSSPIFASVRFCFQSCVKGVGISYLIFVFICFG